MSFRIIFFFIALSSFFLFLPSSCTTDQLEEVTASSICDTLDISYNLNIKPIVDSYCAYSGCHDGVAPGNYTTYDGMVSFLESGSIEGRVINERDMPPSYANAGFTELPDEEFEMIDCWISKGYPE